MHRHSFADHQIDAYRMGRKRRGDIQIFLLWALTVRPMHGYELIQFLNEKTHGLWSPSPGSVYPTLQMLDERGLVTSDDSSGKKVYTITDEGRELADKLPRGSFVDDPKQSEAISNLREANMVIRRMMRKIIMEGSVEDLVSAVEVMNLARSRLLVILENDQKTKPSE